MSSFEEILIAKLDKFAQQFNENKFDEMGKVYHPDLRLLPLGGDLQRGQQAVADAVAGVKIARSYGVDRTERTFTHAERFSADTAMTYSTWVWYKSDGQLGGKQKDVSIWKLVDGDWLMYVDIINKS